jgi:hypothetical protein
MLHLNFAGFSYVGDQSMSFLLILSMRRRASDFGCLQVERQVVLNERGRLNRLDLERSTDVGDRAGAEWKARWVVRLLSLRFCSEVESTLMLQVGREHNGLLAPCEAIESRRSWGRLKRRDFVSSYPTLR